MTTVSIIGIGIGTMGPATAGVVSQGDDSR